MLGDNRLTAALIDRLVLLAFEGESYRLQKALSAIPDEVS
ncbi:ATP-binding protein [Calderihabitans maritimus]|uniref:ATP-binding protein n=1 Tax=Calderihabitans maritimus TaxID=1246530 RepID=A0A1Z5HSY6_9FIRM|nr:ATP-binding protein [Calderihabitans maritimus]